MIHLPAEWVDYLNEVAFFQHPQASSQEKFARGIQQARDWLHFESAFWTHQAESVQLANLSSLLEELGKAPPRVDALVPRAFQAVEWMEEITQGRERAQYSRHPVLNDLALATACFLRGQAERRALPERCERVRVWLDSLRAGYEQLAGGLPQPVQLDFQQSFQLFERSLDLLGQARDVEKALTTLLQSSENLDILLSWMQQAQSQQEQHYTRWSLPRVSVRLQRCFENLRLASPTERLTLWEQQARAAIFELSLWWGQHRELLPLPARFLEDWLPLVDDELQALLDVDFGAELGDAELEQLEQALDRLSEGLAEGQQRQLPAAHLEGGSAGHYFELIQGLLRNTLPVVAVPELLKSAPAPQAWSDVAAAILEYSKGGPREYLYEAREELLRKVPAPQLEACSWTCSVCHHACPPGHQTCGFCGNNRAGASVEAVCWSA